MITLKKALFPPLSPSIRIFQNFFWWEKWERDGEGGSVGLCCRKRKSGIRRQNRFQLNDDDYDDDIYTFI